MYIYNIVGTRSTVCLGTGTSHDCNPINRHATCYVRRTDRLLVFKMLGMQVPKCGTIRLACASLPRSAVQFSWTCSSDSHPSASGGISQIGHSHVTTELGVACSVELSRINDNASSCSRCDHTMHELGVVFLLQGGLRQLWSI